MDPVTLKHQVNELVPSDVQQILAKTGIRDEHIFPTPVVLEARPTLVGYYRLITGVSQKDFYRPATGMSPFRKMENDGRIGPDERSRLPEFCEAMAKILAEFIRGIAPAFARRDVHDLQMLTLGSYFYGRSNNTVGQLATQGVFLAIAESAGRHITERTGTELTVTSPSGRTFNISLASDPDVRVREKLEEAWDNTLAIEIKGGVDNANVYNRGGEAEKSHKAAKSRGYPECWTIIKTKGIDFEKLRSGATNTDAWFDTSEILARQGKDWDDFHRRLTTMLGI